jgi:hypothetical protein
MLRIGPRRNPQAAAPDRVRQIPSAPAETDDRPFRRSRTRRVRGREGRPESGLSAPHALTDQKITFVQPGVTGMNARHDETTAGRRRSVARAVLRTPRPREGARRDPAGMRCLAIFPDHPFVGNLDVDGWRAGASSQGPPRTSAKDPDDEPYALFSISKFLPDHFERFRCLIYAHNRRFLYVMGRCICECRLVPCPRRVLWKTSMAVTGKAM